MTIDPNQYEYADDVLAGRIIMITGASDGIGKALALHVASLGARVVLHGRNSRKLENVYDTIEAMDGAEPPAIAVLDFATAVADDYRKVADSIAESFGRLDGLVNNASMLGERHSIEQYDATQWQRVLHVNLTATFFLTQQLLPALQNAENPSVIFTSSGVGRVGKPFWGAYSVSKFGTEALSQILAAENEHTGLRANCINPGPVRTKMRLEAYPAEDRETLPTAEDILRPYVFLLGPDSKTVTGQSIDVVTK